MISCFKGSGGLIILMWKDTEAELKCVKITFRFRAYNVRRRRNNDGLKTKRNFRLTSALAKHVTQDFDVARV